MPVTEPRTIAIHKDVDGFARQYGTLRNACDAYFAQGRGRMPDEQARAFEKVVPAEFLAAASSARIADAVEALLARFD